MSTNEDYLIIKCPHCDLSVIIYHSDINCRIFRHGVYRVSNEPVHPHLDRESCEKLVESGQIHGCCKPFRLDENNIPEICDYI